MSAGRRSEHRRWRLVVAVCLAAAVVSIGWTVVRERSIATTVRFSQAQETRYLAEMKENLNGHPDRPRFQLVPRGVLVREGVTACRWLAAQPSGDRAQRDDPTRNAYFAAYPLVHGAWPFDQGKTGVRQEILTNAWGWLCADIYADHIDHSPLPDD